MDRPKVAGATPGLGDRAVFRRNYSVMLVTTVAVYTLPAVEVNALFWEGRDLWPRHKR